jgi:hypothetical protein
MGTHCAIVQVNCLPPVLLVGILCPLPICKLTFGTSRSERDLASFFFMQDIIKLDVRV